MVRIVRTMSKGLVRTIEMMSKDDNEAMSKHHEDTSCCGCAGWPHVVAVLGWPHDVAVSVM